LKAQNSIYNVKAPMNAHLIVEPRKQFACRRTFLRFEYLEYSRLDRLREFGRSKKLKLLNPVTHSPASLTLHAIAWHPLLVP